MKRALPMILVMLMLIPQVSGANTTEPIYMRTFQGYLGLGESVIVGNYTLTVVDFLYNPQTWPPVVLFRLRDNSNFTTLTFSLSEGQSYTYGDVRIDLVYIKNPSSSSPRALISIYSRPATVFYGTAHTNTTFIYGPVQLSVLGFTNGTVFMRYYRNGTIDYAYMGRGGHYWHEADIVVYNVTNSSAYMKVLFPKYLRYSIVRGTVVVMKNVSFSPVEVGAPFRLNVTVKNIGDQPARYVRVYLYSQSTVQAQENTQKTLLPTVTLPSFQEEMPFASYLQGPVQYTGSLSPGQARTLHFRLIASKAIKPDVYPLFIQVEYSDENGVVKTEEVQIGIPVNDIERPKVTIENFTIIPTPVSPSARFTVFLRIKNTGNAPAYHVRVELLTTKPTEGQQTYSLFPTGQTQSQESNIYPIGRQSVLYFESLPVNQTGNGSLLFAVNDISNGIYPLYAVITYEDKNGVSYKEQATFGVQVEGLPRLKVYIGNIWMSDGRYNFEVDVANDGEAPARGVTISVSSPVLKVFPLGEHYIGSVESMDYDSANFMILNSTLKAEGYPIEVKVTYLTANGSFTSFNRTVILQIPTDIPNRGRYNYYYGIIIALVLLLIFLWRLKRG
ncbi:COG1361 S-layer family protein [Thermococcus sp.]|uniref:COG1361 S-layer family protein n=1 Tax=Thermococcus sp. TaxID=35749 RepID=UPI0025FEA519|nr:hypothetical protein [Thermococcus sp.]